MNLQISCREIQAEHAVSGSHLSPVRFIFEIILYEATWPVNVKMSV